MPPTTKPSIAAEPADIPAAPPPSSVALYAYETLKAEGNVSVYGGAVSQWDDLARQTPQPDPFCASPAWQLSFYETLPSPLAHTQQQGAKREPLVRKCKDGLLTFAAFTNRGPLKLVALDDGWMFGCNALGPARNDLLVHLVEQSQQLKLKGTVWVVISGIDPDGAFAKWLRARFGVQYRVWTVKQQMQCAASLEGGMAGFMSRRSGNLRRNLRRAQAAATREGIRFERHIPRGSLEAMQMFARMLAIEERSWKGKAEEGMNAPFVMHFYMAMFIRLACRGDARVIFATLNGRDVGYVFGGVAGSIYRGQQFSYDDDYAHLSLGNLLQVQQIEWLCEEGAERYDLGPLNNQSMAYKHHWAEIKLPIEAWAIS